MPFDRIYFPHLSPPCLYPTHLGYIRFIFSEYHHPKGKLGKHAVLILTYSVVPLQRGTAAGSLEVSWEF